MTRTIRALVVDDEKRPWLTDNLETALWNFCDIRVDWTIATSIEDAEKLLPRGLVEFDVVLVDMLWKRVGASADVWDVRGLEVVRQAVLTPQLVVVAYSKGNSDQFPLLHEVAPARGADLFRYLTTLDAATGDGDWMRFAMDIAAAIDRKRGLPPPLPVPNGSVATVASTGAVRTDLFIVHGRNMKLVSSLMEVLDHGGLHALKWRELMELAIKDLGKGGNPDVFDVVEHGFRVAHGAIVLFSPDDEARLTKRLQDGATERAERGLVGQPRQNVLLEAGYAMRHDRAHTLIVQVGELRPISDFAGMHILRLDDSVPSRDGLRKRLQAMGFAVKDSPDWYTVGDFTI